jgi:hypothetical protein
MTRARAGVCRRCSHWLMIAEGMCLPCRQRTQTCLGQLELTVVTIAANRGRENGVDMYDPADTRRHVMPCIPGRPICSDGRSSPAAADRKELRIPT